MAPSHSQPILTGAAPGKGASKNLRALGVSARASMALQYAKLAAKLGVGFYAPGLSHPRGANMAPTTTSSGGVPGVLPHVTMIYCDGDVVDGPFALREALMKRHRIQCSHELAKQRVIAGAIDKHQGLSHLPVLRSIPYTRLFLSPRLNCYDDEEVSIILKAQLDLWPTAHKQRIIALAAATAAGSGSAAPLANDSCRLCGQVPETVSHILSLPQDQSPLDIPGGSPLLTGMHPPSLSMRATKRHDRIVKIIATHLQELQIFSTIIVEKAVFSCLEPDTWKKHALDKILHFPHEHEQCGEGTCAAGADHASSATPTVHSRPDMILVGRHPEEADGARESTGRRCLILDIVCTGDEYALVEQEIGFDALSKQRRKFSEAGLHLSRGCEVDLARTVGQAEARMLDLQPATNRKAKCRSSPTASKLNKYAAYADHIHGMLLNPYSPESVSATALRKLLDPIMHAIFESIITIYRAWATAVPPRQM